MFRPIDDTFFEVLADDRAFCQEMLRVILEDNALMVEEVKVQKDEPNLAGRGVRLDVLCTVEGGIKCNIEVQRANDDDHFRRIRYNAACITVGETEKGIRFKDIPTVIIVYISEFDLLHRGYTAYHIDKVVRETGEIIDDGLKAVCVNTKVNDGTDIAQLMQLFNQTEVNSEKFPEFTRRMNYIKHSEGGRKNMCSIMEEYAKEYAEEYAKEYAKESIIEKIKNALKKGNAPEIIANILDVPLEMVMELKKTI